MKQVFEITNQNIINEVLNNAEYGTLAICDNDKPYSLPLNFVKINEDIYFHSSKKGRKIDILQNNQFASFSVAESYSLIQSYFSSNDELACPATQFFQSIIIDGNIEFVEDYDEKVLALQKLMEKLQPEGKYKPLNDEVYQKMINVTTIYKLVPNETRAKFKFGQHLNQERFEMIISYLEKRNNPKDMLTIKLMKELK